MHRYSLDRFKKAQAAEPFSVNTGVQARTSFPAVQSYVPTSAPATTNHVLPPASSKPLAAESTAVPSTSIGGSQSTWQPPDWAVEPRPGLYWLDVAKDGDVVDKINLEKRRNIFGRQAIMCDYVLDHPSVSRQHAVVVQHKNGSVYVIDLGSVHGTFVANERLSKDSPVELEVGQSLKFAASTRAYVLKKGVAQVPQLLQPPVNFVLPPPPDPSDEESVVAYNTLINKLGMSRPSPSGPKNQASQSRPADRLFKKPRKARVTFRDQYDGVLVEVVGVSDGADVSTEPGPLGVKEGSLVGRFDDLVEITVIPKGKEGSGTKVSPQNVSAKGVTQKLQQLIEKVKSPGKGGLYDDSIAVASWAGSVDNDVVMVNMSNEEGNCRNESRSEARQKSSTFDDDLDDLFGDA